MKNQNPKFDFFKRLRFAPKNQKSTPKIKNLTQKNQKSIPQNPKTLKTKNRFPKYQSSIFGAFKEWRSKGDRSKKDQPKGPKFDS